MSRLALVLAAAFVATPALAEDYTDSAQHSCAQYYPAHLLRAGVGGVSQVKFFVTREGRTKKIAIAESSGNRDLDMMAMVCAAHWRYKPLMQDGVTADALWQAKVVWDPQARAESSN